ncbi:hypothetical protein B0J11DRAFT_543194 [Dendryphion nanum]|uniref:Uncharacterized protein n=1 Tax=Dendryphion nanum TaxID=256645 RepID=A0A9P9I8M1_9PLEO|nr:hypothetical protein B0J11DRAFT_543194 [Dendryphion nanum]
MQVMDAEAAKTDKTGWFTRTLVRETRRWLRSAKREEIEQRPIARLQNPESQDRYAGYLIMFVCYFLRIVVDGGRRGGQSR